jgi:succinate dehydrogenase / fumarate reductase cytochrome b subunit
MSNTVINPKGPRPDVAERTSKAWVQTYLQSSVGSKLLMALTGAGLVTFVVFHLIGNLKIFSGPESINAYAHFLKHDLGLLIWFARAGLLGIFVVHLALALKLKGRANAARPIGYINRKAAQSNPAATTMVWTGIVIGAFVVFHLAHYTFAWVHETTDASGKVVNYLQLKDAKGHHDVYRMMVAGFSTWWIAVIYLLAQVLLFVHLSHGIASVFQTLGILGRRFTKPVKLFAVLLSGLVFVGNTAIVVAVWRGWIQ